MNCQGATPIIAVLPRFRPVWLVIILLPIPTSAQIRISSKEAADLAQHQIILRTLPLQDKRWNAYEALAQFEAAPEAVKRYLLDFDNHASLNPTAKDTEVSDKKENQALIRYTLKPFLGRQKRYQIRIWTPPSKSKDFLRWTIVPWPGLKPRETLTEGEGYWRIEEVSNQPERTLVLFHVYMDPSPIPWGVDWFVNSNTKSSIAQTVRRLRERLREFKFTQNPIE